MRSGRAPHFTLHDSCPVLSRQARPSKLSMGAPASRGALLLCHIQSTRFHGASSPRTAFRMGVASRWYLLPSHACTFLKSHWWAWSSWSFTCTRRWAGRSLKVESATCPPCRRMSSSSSAPPGTCRAAPSHSASSSSPSSVVLRMRLPGSVQAVPVSTPTVPRPMVSSTSQRASMPSDSKGGTSPALPRVPNPSSSTSRPAALPSTISQGSLSERDPSR
mmetsp:Transcript_29795/g.83245  ORF Transcript_29795/g.83245 Transcript_29795/m.83245 type:complete len:219 (-) Transcript_29795:2529-3185(-)